MSHCPSLSFNIFPYSHRVGVMCVTDLTLANKCIIFRRTFPNAFILMESTDHRFYLETVNHASRYTLHSTAPRQLQSRGQVRNKRNNEIVGFAKVFSPIILEMQFCQSFFTAKVSVYTVCHKLFIVPSLLLAKACCKVVF